MKKIYYPIALRLKNEPVLVVGGGGVAERKVKALLESGADVRVVSPDLTAPLKRLFWSGGIAWLSRAVRSSDVKGAAVIIAATSNAAVNRKISRWAKKQGALVNIVDKAGLSSFISPAVFNARGVIVAVYTDGKDPVLSRDLKNFIKERWNEFIYYRNRL